MAYSVDLLGGASQALTTAATTTTAVNLPDGGAAQWMLEITYEGTAGDGGDSFHPILQTTLDGGSVWQDVASSASMAGGVVAAVTEFIEALTPKASARLAASDGAINASTINSTALGPRVRIKGKFSDADNDGSWTISRARLHIYR